MDSKGSILVVDDEAGIRQGCERVLKPAGYAVDTASTLFEGARAIKTNDYDVVLIDLMLPDGHGIDLLHQIHAKDQETICIIITGYATVELAVQAIKRGAYDFISKPFNADLLVLTVEQGMEKRTLSLEAKRLRKIEQEAEKLAIAKDEMEKIDRYKTWFMWTMAHELRSPVAGSLSLLRTLRFSAGTDFTPQQTDIMGRIEQRLDKLMELINDLLMLAKSKNTDNGLVIESISILPFLSELMDRYQERAAAKSIDLGFISPQNEIYVLGTRDGLDTIFSNLIDNALKYSPSGGEIGIQVRFVNDSVEITVSDTGIGIPKDEINELFQEFFRASNVKKSKIIGTGLGLSIVKQYVDQFGGEIDVVSIEGRGTTFTVKLRSPKY